MFGNEHTLLVNTLFSLLHRFCTTGVTSGISSWGDLELVHEGGWERLLLRGGRASDFIVVS
jgi:hypothetical protein